MISFTINQRGDFLLPLTKITIIPLISKVQKGIIEIVR
jgi:hypothetical protein